MNDHDQNHSHGGNNLPTFISGIVLGAALSYLFGTKDGKKLKNQLLKEGQKLLEEMGKDLEEVKDKIQEEDPLAKLEAVKDKIEEVKEELQGKVEDVPKHIEELQKKGRRFFFHRRASHES